jgi:hypothetical protein
MLHRRFVSKIHEEFGTLGWQPIDMPEADPLQGMATAHDVLEHFPGDTGSAEGELQALGAALWLRGLGGYWYRYSNAYEKNPGKQVAGDLPEVMRHVMYEGHRLSLPSFGRYALDSYAEAWIDDCLKDYTEEARDIFEGEETALAFSEDTLLRIRRYLRHGYRRAQRRYARPGWSEHTASEMTTLFHTIEEDADGFLKTAEENYELIVNVSLKRHEANVKMRAPWEQGFTG